MVKDLLQKIDKNILKLIRRKTIQQIGSNIHSVLQFFSSF